MTAYEHVLTDVTDAIGTITLNRPDKLNAFAGTMRQEVAQVVHEMAGDTNVRVNFETNLSTNQVLVNALYEWRNQSSLIPFVGGTLGWASNRAVSERTPAGCKGCSLLLPQVSGALPLFVRTDTTVHNLAWGAMAGVDWRFGERWSLEFAYRFINLGGIDTDFFLPTDDRITGDPYTSHDILISLLFHIRGRQ